MNIEKFITELNLSGQKLYNARSAIRTYVKWLDPKLSKLISGSKTIDLTVTDISISPELINAYATEGRTQKNHAVILRQLLVVHQQLTGSDQRVPAYVVHSLKIQELLTYLHQNDLS
jgi:hypothetical protein